MNVENRKLFANRDARKRLAEMGGILASSPELMGEAMKFANGGTARERAISGQGALDQFASSGMQPLDFSFRDLDRDLGSEMQALDDRVQGRIVSFLGNLFEVVGDKIFHTESGVEIEEPNLKAEILTQGDRIAGEDMAMAVPFPQGQARNYTQLVSDIENPIERGRALLAASSPEVELENAPITSLNRIAGEDLAMAQDVPQGQPRAFVPKTPSEDIISMGPMEMERLSKQPILQQELAKAVLSQQSEVPSAEDLMAGPIYPAEERSSDKNARQRAISELGLTPITRNGKEYFISPAGMVFKRKGEDLVPVDTAEAMQAMDVAQQQGKDFTKSPIGMIPIGTRDVDPSTGLVDPDAPLKRPDADISGTRTPQFLTKALGPDSAVSDLLSVQEGARRPQEMADAEREQMTGMPDLAAPEKVDVDVLLDAVEKNDPKAASAALMKSITGVDVHGGTTPPPSDDTPDAPKPDAPKTRKQRMLESVDMISEMFGIREKDKAEDMYDLMATIGFAMASGESPNAMKNIADAFLVGAQMKRADKKEAKADERAIQKLAYQTIQDQDATDAEQKAARDLLKEKYGYLEDLERLKAELNPASQTAKAPSLQKAILDAIGDAAQAKSAPLTEDDIQKVTDMVIRLYQGNYQTGTDSGKTPGQVQSLKDIP